MTSEELKKLVEEKKQPVIVNKGISSLSLLGIILIVLKAVGTITWSWWWVLAPFWIPIVITLIVILSFIVFLIYIQAKVDKISEATENTKETTEKTKGETSKIKEEKPKKSRSKKSKVTKDGENNITGIEEKNG